MSKMSCKESIASHSTRQMIIITLLTVIILSFLWSYVANGIFLNKTSHEYSSNLHSTYNQDTIHKEFAERPSVYKNEPRFSPITAEISDVTDTKRHSKPHQPLRICSTKQRLSHINKQIRLMGYTSDSKGKLLVNDDTNLAYCPIAKMASSTLSRFMVMQTEKARKDPTTMKKNIHDKKRRLSFGLRFVNRSQLHTIEGHRKFMAVRHPFDRLVSVYKSRVMGNQKSAKLIRKTLGIDKTVCITFRLFVDALLLGAHNTHWKPYGGNCLLEQIAYDNVIRLETFQHDVKPILNYAGLTVEDILTERITTNNKRAKNAHKVKNQISFVPKRLNEFSTVPIKNIMKLKEMYRNYFQLFGYEFDAASLEASCVIQTESGDYCC